MSMLKVLSTCYSTDCAHDDPDFPKWSHKRNFAAEVPRGLQTGLFSIAAKKEICVITFPMATWCLALLLFVRKHQEIDKITLE